MLSGPPWFVESSCCPRHIKGAGRRDATITSAAAVVPAPLLSGGGGAGAPGAAALAVVAVGGPKALLFTRVCGGSRLGEWKAVSFLDPSRRGGGARGRGAGGGGEVEVGALSEQIFGLAPREGVGRTRVLTAEGGLCPPSVWFRAPSSVTRPQQRPLSCGPPPLRSGGLNRYSRGEWWSRPSPTSLCLSFPSSAFLFWLLCGAIRGLSYPILQLFWWMVNGEDF